MWRILLKIVFQTIKQKVHGRRNSVYLITMLFFVAGKLGGTYLPTVYGVSTRNRGTHNYTVLI